MSTSATSGKSALQPTSLNAPSPSREVPLHMSPEEFRAAGHGLVDTIAQFLHELPSRSLTSGDSPEVLRALIDANAHVPETGADANELLQSTARLLMDHSLFNGHPRFFGYITSSPAQIGMLAELLAASVNANVGAWRLSPIATEIEAQTVRWIAELVGYPPDGSGLMVSGGNMANMVGFLAARAAAAGQEVRTAGLNAPNAPRLRAYASAETHTWIQKAADIAGIGTDSIRWIPVDGNQRMDMNALRTAVARDVAAGDRPMAVVGTSGSVSTGAVDPLFEMSAFCRDNGIWFHVDGAYGAFASMVPGAPHELAGVGLADSLAVDPHKWLYSPIEAGCTLVRDPDALRNAFAYHPPYYHFGQEALNYTDLGPQNSRGFRALKVWLALRQAGRSGYARMIGDDIALSQRLADNVTKYPELEPLTQKLSITTFRYVPEDMREQLARHGEYLNRLNETILDRLQLAGEAFVSNAVIDGRYALRACIVNFNTTAADVDVLPEIIVRLGREMDRKMRGAYAT